MSFFKSLFLFTPLILQLQPIFSLSDSDSNSQEMENFYSEKTAEPEIKNTDISFDFGVMSDAIKHNGFGFGIKGEYLFTRFFSINGGFSHSALFSESGNAVYTTETVSMNLYCYPFGLGLNKYFYFGGGSSTEFIQLTGADFSEENSKKTAIFLQAQAGWKQPLNKYIGLEAFTGYKKLLYSVDLPKDCEHLVDHGFFFGLEVKFNFGNIYRAIKSYFQE